MHVTPGAAFLARRVVAPTALHFGLLTVASRLTSSNFPSFPHIPSWVLFALSFLVLPARLAVSIAYKRWHNRREAERRGARLAPKLPGKKFGNTDNLEYLMNCWKNGYICAYMKAGRVKSTAYTCARRRSERDVLRPRPSIRPRYPFWRGCLDGLA